MMRNLILFLLIAAFGAEAANVNNSTKNKQNPPRNKKFVSSTSRSQQLRKRPNISLSELEVRRHILLSGEYLLSQIQPDGRFIYRQHLDPDVKYSGNLYNVVRHAGTLYALGEYYKAFPAPSVKEKILLSANYLIRNYIKPIPGYKGVYAVISKPEEAASDKQPVAKLGGTGLALTALVPLYKIDKRIISKKKLQGLGQFLIFMQKPDGSGNSKYYPYTKKFSKFQSLYYPGEAALGLISLYEVDKNPMWFRFGKQYLLNLARNRQQAKSVPADHWALIATQKLLESGNKLLKKSEVALLENHAKQVLESIMNTQNFSKKNMYTYGAFNNSDMTSPTATRMEGIIAGYKIFKDKDKLLKNRIIKSIAAGMYFLLNAQNKEGLLKGGTPRALTPLANTPKNKRYNERVGEIRIDYVQHAMSAMIDYLNLLTK